MRTLIRLVPLRLQQIVRILCALACAPCCYSARARASLLAVPAMLGALLALGVTGGQLHASAQYGNVPKGDRSEGCADSCDALNSPYPVSYNPVDLYRGYKREVATDLLVALVGDDFVLTREYTNDLRFADTSVPPISIPSPSGPGWTFSLFAEIEAESPGDRILFWGGGRPTVSFNAVGDHTTSSAYFQANGATTQTCTRSVIGVVEPDGSTLVHRAVVSLVEPGGRVRHFVRPSASFDPTTPTISDDDRLYGLPIQTEDAYGNKWVYHYDRVVDPGPPSGLPSGQRPRADAIRCYTANDVLQAVITFRWIYTDSDDYTNPGARTLLAGRLRSVKVERFDGTTPVETNYIRYSYFDDVFAPTGSSAPFTPATANELGSSKDLVQVVTYDRMDAREASPHEGTDRGYDARVRVSQYRYYGAEDIGGCPECIGIDVPSGTDSPDSDELLQLRHQLRVVISPQQIEYFAQQMNSQYMATRLSLLERADALLTKTASDDLWTADGYTFRVYDLATKVIVYDVTDVPNYDSPKVIGELLRTASCGCGSILTGHGRYMKYEYITHPSTSPYCSTTVLTEHRFVGGATPYQAYRVFRKDLALLGFSGPSGAATVPYLINDVLIDYADPDNPWVTHYVYDSSRRLVRVMEPSATESYTAYETVTEGPRYEAKNDEGLVRACAYTASNRLAEKRVREGAGTQEGTSRGPRDLEVGAAIDDFSIVERTTYGNPANADERAHLPKEIQRFRREGVKTGMQVDAELDADSGAHVERTWFAYKFHGSGGDAIAAAIRQVEKNLKWENGPGTSESDRYRSVQLYNTDGDNVWSIAEDDSVTYREFQASTGLVLGETRNADWSGSSGSFGGVTVDWSDRYAVGGPLKTAWVRDALGRVTRETTPGGVHSYTLRVMRESSRTGMSYYTEVSLPHILDSGAGQYSAPITRISCDAADEDFDERDFVVGSLTLTSGTPGSFVHPVQSYAIASSNPDLSRRVVEQGHTGFRAKETVWWDIANNGTHVQQFRYDSLGRLRLDVNPNGTVTRYSYDVHDRVTMVEVGTQASTSLQDLADGAGNPRPVRELYYDHELVSGEPMQGVGDGNLTFVRERPTGSTSDDRDSIQSYDFRDRLVILQNPDEPHEVRTYDNLDRLIERALFGVVPTDITASSNRGLYEVTSYSQRGLQYRTARAIDPTATDSSTDGFLEWHAWHDPVGRVIQEWGPNQPAVKREYDGLGRETLTCYSDRGIDPTPTPAVGATMPVDTFTGHAYSEGAHTIGLADDAVLEQTETRYISNSTGVGSHVGEVDLITTRTRAHDSSYTGSLYDRRTTVDVVTTYVGYQYDAADRVVKTIDFGTNWTSGDPSTGDPASSPDPNMLRYGGSQPTPTSPGSSDRIWKTTYNARGLVDTQTGARTLPGTPAVEITAKYFYDDLDRIVGLIDNWKSGTSIAPGSTSGAGLDLTLGSGSGGHTSGAADQDRTTIAKYDGLGNIAALAAAHDDGTGAVQYQLTRYVYGVAPSGETPPTNGTSGSELWSNDLLARVIYPDGDTSSDNISYSYNRLGELLRSTDQNGTVHDFARDLLGRTTTDHASTISSTSNIDTKTRKLTASFDALGRLDTVKSLDGSDAILNAIQFTYNKRWQVNTIVQNPNGDIGGSNGATVSYTYDTQKLADGNRARPSALGYPTSMTGSGSGTSVAHDYSDASTSTHVNSAISRARKLSWDLSTVTHRAEYDYLGLNEIVQKDYIWPGLRLDRRVNPTDASGTGAVSGRYPGLDRFGRVRTQTWLRDSWARNSKPEVVHLEYTYDAESNPITRSDRRAGDRSSRANRDERYTHDPLHRLTQADRGSLNHSTSAFTIGGTRGQNWALDGVGNWTTTIFDLNGNGAYDSNTSSTPYSADAVDKRKFNGVNEIRDTSGSADQTILNPEINVSTPANADPRYFYDRAGNLVCKPVFNIDSKNSTYTKDPWYYRYDAWNRLVAAYVYPAYSGSPPSESAIFSDTHLKLKATYTYHGIHWRASRTADTNTTEGIDQANLYYYDDDWRLLEERIDETYSPPSTPTDPIAGFGSDRVTQRFWGPEYIDEMIAQASVPIVSSSYGTIRTSYALHDRLYSPLGFVESASGLVLERVRYTSYGIARHAPYGDFDGDGDVQFDDLNAVLGAYGAGYTAGGYDPELDFDQSGAIDYADQNAAVVYRAALAEGLISDPTSGSSGGIGNTVGYCGYQFDPVTRLSLARHRWYDPTLGRWLSRDPYEYVDAMNLSSYVGGWPLWTLDPFGLYSFWDVFREGRGVIRDWVRHPGGMIRETQEAYCDSHWIFRGGLDAIGAGDGLHFIACPTLKGALAVAANLAPAAKLVAPLKRLAPALRRLNKAPCALPGLASASMAGKAPCGRLRTKQLRKMWEKEHGKPWPVEKNGRPYDVSHETALADGGDNSIHNIRPRQHGEHIEHHRANGDFVRWGRRGKPPLPFPKRAR